MQTAQSTLNEGLALVRRRKIIIIIPTVIVTAISIVGALLLPRQYESSTTLLVQRDEILNPLLSYEAAMRGEDEDRLRTFNEIIYSRVTIGKLIDSLGIAPGNSTATQQQEMITDLQGKIQTERRGSDSFRITFIDTNPERAQRAASCLANLFMESIRQFENQRNEAAVQFYENKLSEIRDKFEESQKKVVTAIQSRVEGAPVESRYLYTQIEDLQRKINELDARMTSYRQSLVVLRAFPQAIKTEKGKQALYDLQREPVPFAADLHDLMVKYSDYVRKYTEKYPEVTKLEGQITDLLGRMKSAMESELPKMEPQRWDLERQLSKILNDIKQSSVEQRVAGDKDSDYDIYKKLYDEMTVKLEQAQATRDLGVKGSNHFIVIDPAIVPPRPSKPNRPQIVGAGFGLGLFLGILALILREMMDTTIRTPRDIEVFQKPVIALITSGQEETKE